MWLGLAKFPLVAITGLRVGLTGSAHREQAELAEASSGGRSPWLPLASRGSRGSGCLHIVHRTPESGASDEEVLVRFGIYLFRGHFGGHVLDKFSPPLRSLALDYSDP